MRDTLRSGGSIGNNERITSGNNAYHLVMQGDGNLVLYVSNHPVPENAIWTSNTCNKSPFVGPYRMTMQHDGNLVVYDTYNRAMWTSNTCYKGATTTSFSDAERWKSSYLRW